MTRKPALVFDIGRVLINWNHEITLNALKVFAPKGVLLLKINPFPGENLNRLERGETEPEVYYRDLMAHYHITCTLDQFRDAWNAMLFEEMPGMFDLLSELKSRYRIVAFSNTCKDHMIYCLKVFPIMHLLDGLAQSDKLGCLKPDLISYRKVEQEFLGGEKPLYFTDDLPANIEGAKKAGWPAGVFTGSAALRETYRGMGIL